MKIAVEGCAHGELDNIYDSILALEEEKQFKIDLLICCGDFQAVRNEHDLRCMAIPEKYYNICTFYKYYSGEKKAPVLTIFVGGNHEASNYLQELPYGGWVAPNIYYLGYGNVINIGGLRIGGLSGIFKGKDYMKGHFELNPYNDSTKRSVYHIRNIEVFRFKQLSESMDIFLSHDWPQDITDHGNVQQLLNFKPFFKDDIESGQLGSAPAKELLFKLKPKYWFAAHLHCKFAALVEHEDESITKFLALDKCLPNKRFLQILDIPHDEANDNFSIHYDLEWLTILTLTNHLFSIKSSNNYLPSKMGHERWQFTPTEEEKQNVLDKFGKDLQVPLNFKITAESYVVGTPIKGNSVQQPKAVINAQTAEFCQRLGILNPTEEILKLLPAEENSGSEVESSFTSFIEDTDVSKDINESISFSTISPVKRVSMSLPKPVNEVSECTESDDVEDNTSIKNSKGDEECEPAVAEEKAESNDIPVIKKLKRRNASVYNPEEEE